VQSDILAELDELAHSLLADNHPVRTTAAPEELSLEPLESLLGEVSPPTGTDEEPPAAEAQTEANPTDREADVPEAVPEELGVEELVDVSGAVDGPPIVVLQQIDFFIEQGLYEDALRILSGLEMDFPDDPDVAKRRLTLKEQGIIVEEPVPAEAEDTAQLFAEEDGYVDLAQELEAELAEEEALVEAATGEGQDEALLDEVFKEFRKGVAEQLSEEDSDTHFNLGIAYKEMGLFPEAIGEFEIASKDPKFYLECCSMIAVCYVEQGLFDQAVSWYRRALDIEDLPKAAQLALMYDLATVLESAGDDIQALDLFSQVAEMDPDYRDIGSRLRDLQKQRNVN
jgi:tetratricopeptide (TPR) repeat protein